MVYGRGSGCTVVITTQVGGWVVEGQRQLLRGNGNGNGYSCMPGGARPRAKGAVRTEQATDDEA